jgi:hypothetical protein
VVTSNMNGRGHENQVRGTDPINSSGKGTDETVREEIGTRDELTVTLRMDEAKRTAPSEGAQQGERRDDPLRTGHVLPPVSASLSSSCYESVEYQNTLLRRQLKRYQAEAERATRAEENAVREAISHKQRADTADVGAAAVVRQRELDVEAQVEAARQSAGRAEAQKLEGHLDYLKRLHRAELQRTISSMEDKAEQMRKTFTHQGDEFVAAQRRKDQELAEMRYQYQSATVRAGTASAELGHTLDQLKLEAESRRKSEEEVVSLKERIDAEVTRRVQEKSEAQFHPIAPTDQSVAPKQVSHQHSSALIRPEDDLIDRKEYGRAPPVSDFCRRSTDDMDATRVPGDVLPNPGLPRGGAAPHGVYVGSQVGRSLPVEGLGLYSVEAEPELLSMPNLSREQFEELEQLEHRLVQLDLKQLHLNKFNPVGSGDKSNLANLKQKLLDTKDVVQRRIEQLTMPPRTSPVSGLIPAVHFNNPSQPLVLNAYTGELRQLRTISDQTRKMREDEQFFDQSPRNMSDQIETERCRSVAGLTYADGGTNRDGYHDPGGTEDPSDPRRASNDPNDPRRDSDGPRPLSSPPP